MAKYEQVFVKSIAEYDEAMTKHTGKRIIAIFAGSLNENGESWCSDCRLAEPVIEACLEHAKLENAVVIYCEVGNRDQWKTPDNVYRKDGRLRLKTVPTVIDVTSGRRLEEAECADAELVKLLLEEQA